jgi:hypothetical protein
VVLVPPLALAPPVELAPELEPVPPVPVVPSSDAEHAVRKEKPTRTPRNCRFFIVGIDRQQQ